MKNKQYSLSRSYKIIFCLLAITALAFSVSNAQQCPAGHPVDYGNGYCCSSNYPYCGSDGYCYDQPIGTTTIPSNSTTTTPGGSVTTTTPGGGENSTYIAAINITGSGEQDAPQTSGTLPGTSPSEIMPLSVYEGTGRPMPLIIKDRFFPPLDKKLYEKSLEILKKERLSAGPQISTYALGDVKQFWVKDDKDVVWRQVAATSKKEGAHSIIYVDNSLNMADADLDSYVTEFEEMFTIISNNIGTFSDRDI
ncbi:MAG: hypothetical protein NTV89_18265 [Proteobacteria bacterium]|nr:hypothetical protein [Pseudomonadota bacterium]